MAETASVRVAGAVIEAVLVAARAAAPRECCGLLIGRGQDVLRAHPARNVAADASRYEIAPEDHFAALRAARADGLAVLGAYHSHPAGPPVPSATDRSEAVGEFFYLIAGLAPAPEVRLWHLVAGNFVPLGFVRT